MAKKQSRREFLKTAAVTSAGLTLGATAFPAGSYSRILGANDRVNFAVIGLRGRGESHLESISVCKNCTVTHVCDVDRRELDKGGAMTKKLFQAQNSGTFSWLQCRRQL